MDKKKALNLKIVMGIAAGIIVGLLIYYLIELYVIGKLSYFTTHFTIAVCLFCIGIIALLLPKINQRKFSGEGKGDSMMIVVGFLLILCSLISIMISYLG